mgnify:CR=1 FL=1
MSSSLLASKIIVVEEEPKIRTIVGVSTAVTGFLGITQKGPVGAATLINSVDEYDAIFGSYTADGDVRQSIDGFFQNGGSQAYVVRTVHYSDASDATTKTSAKANAMLQTGTVAAYGGSVTGSVVGPFNLAPGDTLIVDTDAISPTTATITAVAATRESSSGTWVLTNGMTLLVALDGGGVQTITFLTGEFVSIGAATAAEVAAVINAKLVGGSAMVTNTNKVSIFSDKLGTGSSVNVSGGTANAGLLAFTTGAVAGTGNVANVDAVTVTEIKTIVEAAVTGVTVSNSGGAVKITRTGATGASATVQVTASSTADDELGFDNAVHPGSDGAAVDTLQVEGKYDGTYAHVLKGKVAAATSGNAAEFNFIVLKNGLIVETFPNVTMDDTATNYIETVVNNATTGSKYITVIDQDAGTGAASTDRPANATSSFLSGGDDGLASLADTDFTGATGVNGKTGLRCFDTVQELNLLAVPGRATSAVHNAMITYCEVTRDKTMFAILDSPANQSAEDVITYFETTAAILGLSEHAAAYWPRIKVLNPSKTVFGTADQLTVPPSGHIAGVYARTDASKPGGVYEFPAGVEQGILLGCLGFETDEVLEEEKRDLVYPKRINPLTTYPGAPRHIDGSRTLKGDGNFPSVAERRGAIFIEQSIKRGLQFARHKKNTENLRQSVSRTCEAFLLVQMRNGAFRSNDPATAFSVDFGEGLNPASVQFAGQLIGRIGIATAKPAEYIVLRFSQDVRALEEELAG